MQSQDDNRLKPHHAAWLNNHPNRDVEWLRERFKDGFDVHHIDGDHGNNEPSNLVLIEHLDHMRLHGMKMTQGRLRFLNGMKLGKRKPKRTLELPDGRLISLFFREQSRAVLTRYMQYPDDREWIERTI